MEIVRWPEARTPAPLRAQIVGLQHRAWPADDAADDGLTHDPSLLPITLALIDDGKVIAALDILSKTIGHRGHEYRASGLSTVVVDPVSRGRGYGHRLVVAARQAMKDAGADLAVFTCDLPLQRFYERAGFEALPGTVVIGGTVQQPFASDRPGFEKVTMAAFYTADAVARRDDFLHCRLELYPGDIDKLW